MSLSPKLRTQSANPLTRAELDFNFSSLAEAANSLSEKLGEGFSSGIWVPVLAQGFTEVVGNPATKVGSWTRFGNLARVVCDISPHYIYNDGDLTPSLGVNETSNGDFTISGLPFQAVASLQRICIRDGAFNEDVTFKFRCSAQGLLFEAGPMRPVLA